MSRDNASGIPSAALRSTLALALAHAACAAALAGGPIYVDDDAPAGGDGLSWDTAFVDLQDAILLALSIPGDDEIRIGQGTYLPDSGTGLREMAFEPHSGLQLRGGFAGFGAADPDARDPAAFLTILSGDLAGNDVPGDDLTAAENSYHVVRLVDVTGVLIDGVVVSGGNANGVNLDARGGGVHASSAAWNLLDCTVIENNGENGAGVYAMGGVLTLERTTVSCNEATWWGGGISLDGGALDLTGCSLTGNAAELDGGAVHGLNCSITMSECTIDDNSAGPGCDGGAVHLLAGSLEIANSTVSGCHGTNGAALSLVTGSSLTLADCMFDANIADGFGGGVYTEESSVDVCNCTFAGNQSGTDGSGSGAALRIGGGGPLTVQGSTFEENASGRHGGAIQAIGPTSAITECSFVGNTAAEAGGAIMWEPGGDDLGVLDVAGCTFDSNEAEDGGDMSVGASHDYDEPRSITNCTFSGSTATRWGGSIIIDGGGAVTFASCVFQDASSGSLGGAVWANAIGTIDFDACEFLNCTAEGAAGALHAWNGVNSLRDCLFVGNAVLDRHFNDGGGAIFARSGATLLCDRCVIIGNTAAQNGGGLHCDSADLVMRDCIVAHNQSGGDLPYGGGGLLLRGGSTAELDRCTIAGNNGATPGAGVRAVDSTVAITGTILFGNDGPSPPGEQDQIALDDSELSIDFSCVEGLTGQYGGTGNIDGDPQFVDVAGEDGIPGTADDDFHLGPGSACVNTGCPDTSIANKTDIDGELRIQDCRVDVGADESPFMTSIDCNDNGLPDHCEIFDGAAADCNGNGVPDACDVDDGTSNDCNGDGVLDECEADCDFDGIPDGCEIDCDGDGTPDACTFGAPIAITSGPLSPIGVNFPQSYTFESLPVAFTDVAIKVEVSGDFDSNSENLDLYVDGEFVRHMFAHPFTENCADPFDAEYHVIPSAEFNEQFAGQGMTVEAVTGNSVNPFECSGSSTIVFTITYTPRLLIDCNGNGFLDACDIGFGISEDCNENGVPDECDVVVPVTITSGLLAPFGSGAAQSLTVPATSPFATKDVMLTCSASADLSMTSQSIDVALNGVVLDTIFVVAGNCASPADIETILVASADYNAALAIGDATITMAASEGVDLDACNGFSFVSMRLDYLGITGDENLDGLLDECCPADLAEPIDGNVDVADLIALLLAWGQSGPADLDGDGTVGVTDMVLLIQAWGPCTE